MYHILPLYLPQLLPADLQPTALQDPYYSSWLDNIAWLTMGSPSKSNPNITDFVTSGVGQISTMIGAPLYYDSGVIRVLDRVMQLPGSTMETLLALGLTAFAGAVHGLREDAILDRPKYAFWVPSNEAFRKIGSVLLDTGLPPDELRDLVLVHGLDGSNFVQGQPTPYQYPSLSGTSNLSLHELINRRYAALSL